MTTEEMKAKVHFFTEEAWNKGNVDALDEVFAADIVSQASGFPEARGLAAYKQRITDHRAAYPDFHVTIDEIIAEGNTAADRWTARGTWTGPSASIPMPPTGKHVTVPGTWVGHFEHGKIIEDWLILDVLDWMQQLGVIPLPD